MQITLSSATIIGIAAHRVHVEVDVSYGLVNFFIVGLPDTAIKESTKRIQTALANCGIRLPLKRITVNLAPADLKKVGTQFDLPIAVGILCASEQLQLSQEFLSQTLFLGELSLDGSIKPIKGALVIAHDALKLGITRLIVPVQNQEEVALVPNIEVIGVTHLTELIAHLTGEASIPAFIPAKKESSTYIQGTLDFADVKGQRLAKRALQIATAGKHHILFIGPPGTGKTMLAQRIASIMPPLSYHQMLETTKIYSVSQKTDTKILMHERPFRNPHHSISQAGLVGGGSHPQPGEISLAHNGILFLDELTEFKRDILESLRLPLENGNVSISRVAQTVSYPASPLLVAALNPCPCGYYGDTRKQCICTSAQITKYLSKLSGPLLDRIDLQVHVQALTFETAHQHESSHGSSQALREGVINAIDMQQDRGQNPEVANALLQGTDLEKHCVLTAPAKELIQKIFDKMSLSMRGYHKLLRISRTIADLEASSLIDINHLQEAIGLRSLDQFLEKHRRGQ